MKAPDNLHRIAPATTKTYQSKLPRVPVTLSKEAGTWWKRLIREYMIDDDYGLLLLQTALEAFGRMREAQAVIAEEGLQVTDRYGQIKSHPATTVEKDSRSQMLASFKCMNLDVEPLSKAGRPSTR